MTGKPCDGFEPTGALTGGSGVSVAGMESHDLGLTGHLLIEPCLCLTLLSPRRGRAGVPLQTKSPNQAVAIPSDSATMGRPSPEPTIEGHSPNADRCGHRRHLHGLRCPRRLRG